MLSTRSVLAVSGFLEALRGYGFMGSDANLRPAALLWYADIVESTYRQERYELNVAYNPETGHPKWMTVRLHGQLQTPPDGRPAQVSFNAQGRIIHQAWFENAVPHREDGPAFIDIDPHSGVHVREEYRIHGRAHRSDGPAYVERTADSGAITCELYFLNDDPVDPSTRSGPNRPPRLEP